MYGTKWSGISERTSYQIFLQHRVVHLLQEKTMARWRGSRLTVPSGKGVRVQVTQPFPFLACLSVDCVLLSQSLRTPVVKKANGHLIPFTLQSGVWNLQRQEAWHLIATRHKTFPCNEWIVAEWVRQMQRESTKLEGRNKREKALWTFVN